MVFTGLSDTALTRVDRFASKRTPRPRVQDLILGMYVAEPEGIWTPLGTVTTSRVASHRRGSPHSFNEEAFSKALSNLTNTQLIEILDTALSKSHLLDRVLVPFLKLERAAVALRIAASRSRGVQENT